MNRNTTDLSVRSIQIATKARLQALKEYTRLPFGALIDDAVEQLWGFYEDDEPNLSLTLNTQQSAIND